MPTTGTFGPTTGTFDATTGTPSAPHLVRNTASLTPFRYSDSGRTSAKRRPSEEREDEDHDEEQERSNEEEPEDYDWIEAQLGGLYDYEPSTVDALLSSGVNRVAIRNKINKDRSLVP